VVRRVELGGRRIVVIARLSGEGNELEIIEAPRVLLVLERAAVALSSVEEEVARD
jgi:hypothetical protein